MSDTEVIATIKKIMPAVVSIIVTRHLADVERDFARGVYPFTHAPHEQKDKKRFLVPKALVDKDGMVQVGGGSGFVVDSNGLVLTNKHVINEINAKYTVIMDDDRKYPAEILSRDPINDVAILRIDATNLPVVELGDASTLELGQSVIAIGNALGIFRNTVSVGIVSGLSRAISAKSDPEATPQEMRGLIQTDAAINPGNSGGPLVDLDGRAIGINAAIVFGAQNIGFAIPIAAAKRDLEDIKKYGRIKRPFLGLRYVILDEALGEKMHLSVSYGAFVMRESPHDPGVIPDSPASAAKLEEHDIVLACNGERITKDHTIQDFLEAKEVGDVISVTILRGDRTFDTKLTLAERI